MSIVQPMTYLQLCNKLIEKCGISGAPLVTTANQSGEMARVKGWINEAYLNIQEMYDTWDWMAKDVSFPTVDGKYFYTLSDIGLTDFAEWNKQSFRVYFNTPGVRSEVFLEWLEWPNYRDTYRYGNLRLTTGMPLHISQRPEDRALVLGLTPNAVGYTIDGRYFVAPQTFDADTDTPLFPARFHMVIVYLAMQSYAKYESAPEVLQEGREQFRAMIKRMERDQLQPLSVGVPLL